MHILGIHLDPPFIRCALIRKRNREIEIRSLKAFLLNEMENVKPLYIEEFKGRVVSGISSKDLLVRSIELKIGGNRHIEEAIAFQSEATSHFKPEEILTVPLLQKKEKGNAEALLFTVPRDALKRHLSELEKWEIDPDRVSSVALALCHFVRWKFPKLLNALVIDLGSSETTCAFLENGQLKKAHPVSGGVEALLAALLEDRKKILLKKEIEGAAKQLDLLLLKPGLNPHLTASLTELRQELTKIQYCFSREKIPVIFTGRTDAFIHLCEFLIEGSENHLTLEEQKFAIAIGLALEPTHSQSLQLRREEFFPRKNWRRLGLYAFSLLTASVLLSGLLFGFGVQSNVSRKTKLLNSLQASTRKKLSGDVEEKIDHWIAAIETNNKEYPYIIQAPKVVEVFSWLSSHPLLEELKKEGDPIDLREVRYQLVKFPKIESPKEPYLAKVEIEFQFKSATNARKFHEALRRGDDLINPSLDITWDALNDAFRTSFFLKNRSPYVP